MTFFGGLLLDGITVAILIMSIYRGGRQGLVQSIIRLVGSLAALIAAVLLSKWLSVWLYESALQGGVYSYLSDKIPEETFSTATLASFIENIPSSLLNLLQTTLGIDLTSSLNSAFQNGRPALLLFLTNEVIGPVVLFLTTAILFLLLLILLGFLVRYLARLFRFVNDIPLLGPINCILGGVVGLIRGFLVLFVLAVFVDFLCSITNNSWEVLNQSIIQRTFLYQYLVQFNPVTDFLSEKCSQKDELSLLRSFYRVRGLGSKAIFQLELGISQRTGENK